jgi:hypothetical protein
MAHLAGVVPSDVTTVFFTGGPTGLSFLIDAIATPFSVQSGCSETG